MANNNRNNKHINLIANVNSETGMGLFKIVGNVGGKLSQTALIEMEGFDMGGKRNASNVMTLAATFLNMRADAINAGKAVSETAIRLFMPSQVAISARWAEKLFGEGLDAETAANVMSEKLPSHPEYDEIDHKAWEELINAKANLEELGARVYMRDTSELRVNKLAKIDKTIPDAEIDTLCDKEFEIVNWTGADGRMYAGPAGYEFRLAFDNNQYGIGGNRKFKLTKSRYGYAIKKNVYEPVDEDNHYIPFSQLTVADKAKFRNENGVLLLALKEIEEKLPERNNDNGNNVVEVDMEAFGFCA